MSITKSKKMGNKGYYTLEEIEDKYNLTQSQLGERISVQRGQISKIESGKNLTLRTVAKVFRATGINANLDLGSLGRVALW